MDAADQATYICNRDAVVADVRRHNVGGQRDESVRIADELLPFLVVPSSVYHRMHRAIERMGCDMPIWASLCPRKCPK